MGLSLWLISRSRECATARGQAPAHLFEIENAIIADYARRTPKDISPMLSHRPDVVLVLEGARMAAAPKNVILIIGDGLDDQHVTMGRNYLVGMSGKLRMDQLPFRAGTGRDPVPRR